MLETVKTALRLKNDKFNQEIQDLINACLFDLGLAGAEKATEDNALVKQAVILYAKAHFGFYDNAKEYAERYQQLKITLANASDFQKDEE